MATKEEPRPGLDVVHQSVFRDWYGFLGGLDYESE
jgi:hypothetical protein